MQEATLIRSWKKVLAPLDRAVWSRSQRWPREDARSIFFRIKTFSVLPRRRSCRVGTTSGTVKAEDRTTDVIWGFILER